MKQNLFVIEKLAYGLYDLLEPFLFGYEDVVILTAISLPSYPLAHMRSGQQINFSKMHALQYSKVLI